MKKLGILYRAYLDYRKNTKDDSLCAKERKTYKKTGLKEDKLEVSQFTCTIEEEWIEKIEWGLEYIGKAIAEERQFIRTNSEVVPIEKIKTVSKHSVAHLARHAELITRIPKEGADIIPDKLLMVEKLNDYAVYENRFLYMLLAYLRDFLNLRIEKIEDILRRYKADFNLSKEIKTKKRYISFNSSFIEDRTDNQFYLIDDETKSRLGRIKDCQQIVISYLKTPLMIEVAKSPMIKPPITRTNVLKMNNNFKNAVSLYEYIVDYNGDGYTSSEKITKLNPFQDKMADEISELMVLTSFLTYKYGNNLEEILKANYEEEERLRRIEEEELLAKKIKRLKKRIIEEGYSVDEYLVLMEKRIDDLEAKLKDYEIVKKKLEKTEEILKDTRIERDKLLETKLMLERKIKQMEIEFQRKLEELKRRHLEEMNKLIEETDSKLLAMEEDCNSQLEAKENECIERIDEIERDAENRISYIEEKSKNDIESLRNDLTTRYEAELGKSNEELNSYKENLSRVEAERDELVKLKADLEITTEALISQTKEEAENHIAENDRITEEALEDAKKRIDLAMAELNALRINYELPPHEDYYTKERFNELEETFNTFNCFFKEQWKLTKKYIRKQILWAKYEKKRKINEPIDELKENNIVKEEAQEENTQIENKEEALVDITEDTQVNTEDTKVNTEENQEVENKEEIKENQEDDPKKEDVEDDSTEIKDLIDEALKSQKKKKKK